MGVLQLHKSAAAGYSEAQSALGLSVPSRPFRPPAPSCWHGVVCFGSSALWIAISDCDVLIHRFRFLANGDGVEEDLSKAVEWYRLAAAQV